MLIYNKKSKKTTASYKYIIEQSIILLQKISPKLKIYTNTNSNKFIKEYMKY